MGSPSAATPIPPQPLRPAPAPPPADEAPKPADRPLAAASAILPADDPESGEQLPPALQRAMSCDSVCSDTSVALADLQEPNVTGYLCVGLEYDR
jgi:hypothetical protein